MRHFCKPTGRVLSCLAAAWLFACWGGCEKTSPPPPTDNAPAPAKTPAAEKAPAEKKAVDTGPRKPAPQQGPLGARAVLEKMVAAYHKASSYQDVGRWQMTKQYAGQKPVNQQRPLSVIMVRPDKLQVKANDAQVVADGKQFRATIDFLPGQVLTKEQPAALTLPFFDCDATLAQALSAGPVGPPMQLALLLDKDPLKWLCKGDEFLELGEPGEIYGRACYRVKIARPDGVLVLWIDQETFALLRMIPPLDLLRDELEKQGELQSLSLVVEFTGAKFNAAVDPKLFTFDLPKDAEAVKYFVPSPARLLGKKAPAMKFVDLADKPVTSESLAKKIVVLYFWDSLYPPSRKTLPLLEEIYQKYKSNPAWHSWLSLSTTPRSRARASGICSTSGRSTCRSSASRSRRPTRCGSRIVRWCRTCRFSCSAATASCSISTSSIPTTAADNRASSRTCPRNSTNCWRARTFYPLALQRYDEREKRYQRALDAALRGKSPADAGVREITIPQTKIAPRSDPKHLKLTPLWKCADVKKPGNILVVPGFGGAPRLAIIDSWNAIAEVGLNGKLLAPPHKLDIQNGEVVSYLRTAVGANGKRLFAGCGMEQQRVHLFDENWNRLMSYPADALENRHSGIADVQLADLEGNGKLRLYVSYFGVVGLQAASLEGKRLAFNRLVNNAHLAIGPAEKGRRNLVCTTGRGALAVVDSKLQVVDEVPVPGRPLQWIVAADLLGDGRLRFCCLAGTPQKIGDTLVVGVDLKGERLWSYALPQGFLSQPIEPIIAGKVANGPAGQWLLPGADGSIHILDADGKLLDSFNCGEALCGLAAVEIDGKPALVVATPGGVEAWRVE